MRIINQPTPCIWAEPHRELNPKFPGFTQHRFLSWPSDRTWKETLLDVLDIETKEDQDLSYNYFHHMFDLRLYETTAIETLRDHLTKSDLNWQELGGTWYWDHSGETPKCVDGRRFWVYGTGEWYDDLLRKRPIT
jgi:hypothetical protein